MSLDFNALDASEIRKKIQDLITPSKKTAGKIDPIFGIQTKITLPFTIGVKNYGAL